MKGRFFLSTLTLLLAFSSSANAVVKPKVVTMVEAPTLIESNFFAGSGGQWFETLIAPHSIILVGTSEPASGPTQGEVLAINPLNGATQWDLLIPTPADAIATTATLDSSGNIWIVGSSASAAQSVTPTPTPSPTPSNVQNPGNVAVDPVPPTRAGLTHITLWQVSSAGSLLNSFDYDAQAVLEPTSITLTKNIFTISGNNFHINASLLGKFSKFTQSKVVEPKVQITQNFKDGLYVWKSYLSKSSIPGVSGWKPKSSTPVILKVGSRTGHIYKAYKYSNKVLKVGFLPSIGVVVTTETANGYSVSLLK